MAWDSTDDRPSVGLIPYVFERVGHERTLRNAGDAARTCQKSLMRS
jgi:hypothetical protein